MSLKDKLITGAVITAGLGLLTSPIYLPHTDREAYTVTITDKQVKRKDDSDKYLVFGKLSDGSTRVFQNTDSLLEWKWNSSDFQGELEVGKTYKVDTYGWRIPLFSAYENITDVNPAK